MTLFILALDDSKNNLEWVRASSQLGAKEITEKVFEAVGTFTKGTLPDDDRTLVVVKRTGHGPEA